MNRQNIHEEVIPSKDTYATINIEKYALESFAKEIDYQNQTKLLTKLILEHAYIAKNLDRLVEEKVQEISASQMATIYALINLSESRDDDTGAHIERTARFCQLLAQKARFIPEYADTITDNFIETIYMASPLHDIGKVGIPDKILLKPGKLTEEEFAIMKTHVQIGYDTLSKVGEQYSKNEFLKMGMEITLNHHEKWDGSGYNKGLKGTEIPLSARIMAVSDVYDALRSKRTYKDGFSHEKSIDIIRSDSGSHFDPLLVDVFIQHQEEFRALYDSIKENGIIKQQ